MDGEAAAVAGDGEQAPGVEVCNAYKRWSICGVSKRVSNSEARSAACSSSQCGRPAPPLHTLLALARTQHLRGGEVRLNRRVARRRVRILAEPGGAPLHERNVRVVHPVHRRVAAAEGRRDPAIHAEPLAIRRDEAVGERALGGGEDEALEGRPQAEDVVGHVKNLWVRRGVSGWERGGQQPRAGRRVRSLAASGEVCQSSPQQAALSWHRAPEQCEPLSPGPGRVSAQRRAK